MNIKYGIVTIAFIITIGILVVIKIYKPALNGGSRQQPIAGNYKLVAKYEPLNLFIYTYAASTNNIPDYIINEGDRPIFYRETTSNGFAITHDEKGLDVLVTDCDKNGKIIRRCMNSYYDNSSRLKYLYIDTNGDGLFDVFITYDKNGQRTKEFTQSNMLWIPVQQTNGNQ